MDAIIIKKLKKKKKRERPQKRSHKLFKITITAWENGGRKNVNDAVFRFTDSFFFFKCKSNKK